MSSVKKLAPSKADGLIPELRFPEFVKEGEWVAKKLGEIGEPLMCKRVLKEQTTSNPKNGIPFYKIGTFGKEPDAYIPIELYEEFKNKYSFPKKGDILISASGTIGRLVVYNGLPAYFQDSNIVWLGNDESMVLNSYLFHYYKIIKWQTSDGGIISRLYNSDLKNINISYSKNPQEQQKIATCLSSLDEVIAAHSQRLALLKEHKKGLMQNLFPHPSTSSGGGTVAEPVEAKVPKYRFKEFVNDGEWGEKRLGEVADVSKLAGYEFTKHIKYESKGKIIALRGLNIKNNSLDLSDVKYIDNSELNMLSRSKLYIDDLMFTYIGTIGEVALIEENNKFYLAPNVSRIRANKKVVNPRFLLQFFNIPQFKDIEISKYISSSSQPALTMGNVRLFSILLPSLEEQQKIATCLSSLDALITAQTEKIEQLKLHKKGLMQSLFPKIIE
jgi:type I restriction enzyme S subunit